MLIEYGFTRAQMPDGTAFTFRPSLGRIADLGSPREIVELYADLHGPRAAETAAYVLAVLADQEDVTPLVGTVDVEGEGEAARLVRMPGAMPEAEQALIAQHLMRHGICGKSRPGSGDGGGYSQEFDAAEHITAAVVHLGVTPEAAAELSMTELQMLYEAKFPEQGRKRDVPSADEYRQFMAKMKGAGYVH